MTDDTIAFLEAVVGQPADLVGHGDGAFVAMLVAMQRPGLVKRLVMVSGGFNKSGEAVPDAGWNLDQQAEFLGPADGEVSPTASTTSRWWRPRSPRWPPWSRPCRRRSWPR
jgi:pimeloyl-ACP methyl ester carboxylesterase